MKWSPAYKSENISLQAEHLINSIEKWVVKIGKKGAYRKLHTVMIEITTHKWSVHYRLSLMVLLLVLDLTWRTDGIFWMGALCWSPGLTSSLPTALLLRRKCLEPWKSSGHWEPLDRWGRSTNRTFCWHKGSMNQSINQSIHRSINQSINQSISQSTTNQSVSQSVNWSIRTLLKCQTPSTLWVVQ